MARDTNEKSQLWYADKLREAAREAIIDYREFLSKALAQSKIDIVEREVLAKLTDQKSRNDRP